MLDNERSSKLSASSLLQILAAAFAARALCILVSGVTPSDGDWPVYSRVAENILRGCGVSLSDPAGTACVPHFGGNGLPGYPAFISMVWWLSGVSVAHVLWAQAAAASLAAPRLAYAAGKMAGRRVGLLAGIVAALSPLQALWVRYGLAEALTIGCVTLLLAELALSVAGGRLRLAPVAAVFTAGLFLRLDFIAFAVPVAVIGIWLHGFRLGLLQGTVIAGLMVLPLAVWTVRNLALGSPTMPPAQAWMLPDGSVGPLGYLSWIKTWVRTEEDRAGAMFFQGDQYGRIRIPERAMPSADDKARVSPLLDVLRNQSGQPFPPGVDASFAELAADAAQGRSTAALLGLKAAQAWGLWRKWFQPLPPELTPPDGLRRPQDLTAVVSLMGTASTSVLLELVLRVSRLLLAISALAALVLACFPGRPLARLFTAAALSLVAAKTGISVAGLFIETRYTATAVPILEFAVVLTVAGFWHGATLVVSPGVRQGYSL